MQKNYKGQLAIITGAAGGIGLALAHKCASLGMNLALIDIAEIDSNQFKTKQRVEAFRVDVSDAKMLASAVDVITSRQDIIGLVFNNAGVAAGMNILDTHENDWKWSIDVNLFGVINVLKAFIPYLKKQQEPSWIINTASVSAFLPYHSSLPYHVTKLGVLGISEVLYYQLQQEAPQTGISVLCPGRVNTGIAASEHVRPKYLEKLNETDEQKNKYKQLYKFEAALLKKAVSPDAITDAIFEAIDRNQFYIFTDNSYDEVIHQRFMSIVNGENPPDIFHKT